MMAAFLLGVCLGGAVLFFVGIAVGIREEQRSELERMDRVARRMRRVGSADPTSSASEFAPGRFRK